MAGYIGTRAAVASPGTERKKTFAITTTTTNLTGLSYTPGFVHVYHNGIRLVDSTDYTATDGSTITLTTAAENGDEVVVVSYGTFSPADTYTKAESDDRYVNASGDTMTGDFSVDGTTFKVDSTNNRVGIGTTSPAVPLQVNGLFRLETAAPTIQFSETDTTDQNFSFRLNNGSMIFEQRIDDFSAQTERMRIDSSGRVTMPYQPSFFARLGSDQSETSTGVNEIVIFNTVLHNIGGHYNNSSGIFTAPVSGSYQFNYNIRFNAIASGYMLARVFINNTSAISLYTISVSVGAYETVSMSFTYYLNSGDNVRIYALSSTDASWSIDTNSSFSGYLIG